MLTNNHGTPITHILCPTDLSPRSQRALGFASRIADALDASLTAVFCERAPWFSPAETLPEKDLIEIRSLMRKEIAKCQKPHSKLRWETSIVENSLDPSHDILRLAAEQGADMIVMKARPGVRSAFHFGSIVERVIRGAGCPVMVLPTGFLESGDPAEHPLEFRRILFDYDFSHATDQLFRTAKALSAAYGAELQLLSVLETPAARSGSLSAAVGLRSDLRSSIQGRLSEALHDIGTSTLEVPTVVEWGDHAQKVLEHAEKNNIDLICTTLSPPDTAVEKLYSAYLGQLFATSSCPILIRQSA